MVVILFRTLAHSHTTKEDEHHCEPLTRNWSLLPKRTNVRSEAEVRKVVGPKAKRLRGFTSPNFTTTIKSVKVIKTMFVNVVVGCRQS